jgi:hypothetical protein
MSKRYFLLLSLVSILFASLLLMLVFYSRLASDDYYFIWDVRNNGVIGGLFSQYTGWSGRYAAIFFTNVLFKALDTDQTWYFLWPLTSCLFLTGGLYYLIDAVSFRELFVLQKKEKLIFSILCCAMLFFLSLDIGETWLWYSSLSAYLWSITAFIWGCSFLLGNHKRIISIILSSFCFVYAGGSSEVFSVIYGVMILSFLIYRFKKAVNFRDFLAEPLNNKIIIVYCVFGIAFLIFLLAPGNYLRNQLFPEHHIGAALLISCKSVVKFIVLYLPFRLAYILAFSVPFIAIGSHVKSIHTRLTYSFKSFFVRATILFLSFVFFFFFIVAYVMMETGPPRLWFMVAFLFTIYCVSVCFYAGYSGFIIKEKVEILKRGSIHLAVIVLGYNIYNQHPLCRDYSMEHDMRVEKLVELKKTIDHDTLIILDPLPNSGMLYSSEIGTDTNHFTNKELRMAYELKFQVISGKK